jgi:exosortase family protein XrtG
MTTGILAAALAAYLIGLLLIRRRRWGLVGYLWSAFGLAALIILIGSFGDWHEPLGAFQASLLTTASSWFGVALTTLDRATLVVPDPTGWSVLQIGIECSTLIELSVFAGLILFYPRFPAEERLLRLLLGVAATLAINMLRLGVIVLMVSTLGKPAVPWAHAVVARLVFFVGVVYVYWRMLTLPTLWMVRRDLEVSGRAVL